MEGHGPAHPLTLSLCPACGASSPVEREGSGLRCASCGFDYRSLAGDGTARERWMLTNLGLGPAHQLFMLELHQQILALPVEESNARVAAFAARHGVRLPTGKPLSPFVVLAVTFAVLVGMVLVMAYFFAQAS